MVKLKTRIVSTSSTPDNVQTKVNRFIWQVWGLIAFGILLLSVSAIAHFTRFGFNTDTLLEWADSVVGSIGIELLGAGVVAFLVARISKVYL